MQEKLIDELVEYSYWGNPGEPPAHLKTKKQLAKLGLSPVKPVGKIETRKYTISLFDTNDPASTKPKRKATPAQLEALAKARETQRRQALYREWYEHSGIFLKDKNNAIFWANDLLCREDWVLLDTETTGLYEPQIVQIGILNPKGETVLDSLVKPQRKIPDEAIAIHKITNEDVANAPSFPDIYPQIKEALKGKLVIIYNEEFDKYALKYCCKLHKLPYFSFESDCAMLWASQFAGNWSNYHGNYKYVALGGDHSAIGDCVTCLERIKQIAHSPLIDLSAKFEEFYLSLS